jgi:large subunit ribosomal protein L15
MDTKTDLGTLKPAPGSTHKIKRVGRGPGSGWGKTAARGHKGQRARSGGRSPRGYEGGQMPLQRRLPKRGFRSISRRVFSLVNLRQLAQFPAGTVVDVELLRQRGLVRRRQPVKILGQGEIGHALTVKAHAFSEHAKERIGAAGGTAEVVADA